MSPTTSLERPIFLLLIGLSGVLLFINPMVSMSFDEVYLYPRVLWLWVIILPISILCTVQSVRLQPLKPSRLVYTLAALFVLLCISALFNGTQEWLGPQDRADGVLMHGLYILLAICGLLIGKAKMHSYKPMLFVLVIAGALLALTNILQQVHVLGVINEHAVSGVSATRFGGFMGNRGYLAGAMCLLLPIAMSFATQRIGFIATILIFWALLGAFSRGGWLALVVAGVWLLFHCKLDKRVWQAICIGGVLFLCTSFVYGNFDNHLKGVTSASGREALWKVAFEGAIQKPILGSGITGLYVYSNRQDPKEFLELSTYKDIKRVRRINKTDEEAPSFMVFYNNPKITSVKGKMVSVEKVTLGINKVHNEYLDYALRYGIPSALIYTFLLGFAIWSSRQKAPFLSAAILAYAVYVLTWPEIIRFAPIAWFLMGLALSSHYWSSQLSLTSLKESSVAPAIPEPPA